MHTPTEFDEDHYNTINPPPDSRTATPQDQGQIKASKNLGAFKGPGVLVRGSSDWRRVARTELSPSLRAAAGVSWMLPRAAFQALAVQLNGLAETEDAAKVFDD
jgi:hypothetical protein